MSAWKDDYYVTLYEMAREGRPLSHMASSIGVDRATLKKWVRNRPAAADAINRGRGANPGKNDGGESFGDYVYRRLPEHLQIVWKRLRAAQDEQNGEKAVELLLQNQGKTARQHLFLHALVSTNFNASQACRKLRMSYDTFEKWKKNDPDFIELLRQVQEMKKDFCEAALMGLVKQGEVAAVVFANKTLNRDRGYGIKTEVEYSGGLTHAMLDISDLDLPPDVMRVVLDAIRRKREGEEKQLKEAGRVIPVEAHRVEELAE